MTTITSLLLTACNRKDLLKINKFAYKICSHWGSWGWWWGEDKVFISVFWGFQVSFIGSEELFGVHCPLGKLKFVYPLMEKFLWTPKHAVFVLDVLEDVTSLYDYPNT